VKEKGTRRADSGHDRGEGSPTSSGQKNENPLTRRSRGGEGRRKASVEKKKGVPRGNPSLSEKLS